MLNRQDVPIPRRRYRCWGDHGGRGVVLSLRMRPPRAAGLASRLFLRGGSRWGGAAPPQPWPPLSRRGRRGEREGCRRLGGGEGFWSKRCSLLPACGRVWGAFAPLRWWVPSVWDGGGGCGGRCAGVRRWERGRAHRWAEGEGWKVVGRRNGVRTPWCPSAFDAPAASPRNLLWLQCGAGPSLPLLLWGRSRWAPMVESPTEDIRTNNRFISCLFGQGEKKEVIFSERPLLNTQLWIEDTCIG